MILNKVLLTVGILTLSTALMGETLRGNLSKEGDQVLFTSQGKVYNFQIAKQFEKNIDRVMVNSPAYTFEVTGEIEGDVIKTERPPIVVGDVETLQGQLRLTGEKGVFLIDDQRAIFGRNKDIYGYNFDERSRFHYVGEEVITHGHYEERNGERLYVISAILEANLITADSNNLYPAPVEALEDPTKFVLEEMPKNEHAQSRTPFRLTLNGSDHTPAVGESVLIVTLSGRQGEEPGAAGGHFAIGMGEVQADMSIKGETFNFYFEGPKEVLAGNTNLINYFGHLIQGQQNYRPTFTIYAYGVDKEKLLEVRDLFEEQTHRVRTEKGLAITAVYNCTTTSLDSLKEYGVYGIHNNLLPTVFDPQNLWVFNPFSWGSRNAEGEGKISKLRQLSYVLKTDREYYMPRMALNSFIKNFDKKRIRKKMGIKRVDYVFIPQTTSDRPIGGMSYDQVGEAKKTIALKNKIKAQKAQEEWAKAVLEKGTESAEVLKQAQEILNNAPTKQEEEKEVRELLMTID